MKTLRTALVALPAAALLLTACGADSNETETGEGGGREAAEAAETTEKFEPPETIIGFGGTYTYADGLSISIGEPQHDGETVTIDVTITNGSGFPYDPEEFMTTLQSGNVEAEEVSAFLDNPPGGTALLAGRTGAYQIAYETAEADDLVLAVQPTFMDEFRPEFHVVSDVDAPKEVEVVYPNYDSQEIPVDEVCAFLADSENAIPELIGVIEFANNDDYTMAIGAEVRKNCAEQREPFNEEVERQYDEVWGE